MSIPQNPIFLGIDLGTSSVKTCLVTPAGEVISAAGMEYPILIPAENQAEQDPEAWYQATVSSIRKTLRQSGVKPEQIAAAGLSGQMHGTVCIGADQKPVRPAIIWADQRSTAQVDYVYAKIGKKDLSHLAANPLAPGFMLATWLWLREHEPQTADRVKTLLLPKDYLRLRLTGEIGAEPSDASSTLLFSPLESGWSGELLDLLEIDRALLPELSPSASIAGTLRQPAADEAGLPAGIPVVYGASDQAAQATGIGIISPGQVSVTIGTGGQIFAPTRRPKPDPQLRLHLFCHAAPHLWHYEAAILSAGLSLQWLRNTLFPGRSYQAMADLAGLAPPGSSGLLFLPHLLGERTPYMDSHSRAAFIGLTLRHTASHLIRAVMEGVVFELRLGLELIEGLGQPVEKVTASGGAARHPLWLQLQANIFNRPVLVSAVEEAAASGAAILAMAGAGLYPTVASACLAASTPVSTEIHPEPEQVEKYADIFLRFKKLYPALQSVAPYTQV